MSKLQTTDLIQQSLNAKKSAFAPYSEFKVGAVLVTKGKQIYTGCNIESSSYGLTICAERVAMFKAISEGERDFSKIFIATDSKKFCPPCGACRQVLWELAGNIEIVLVNCNGEYRNYQLNDLLPEAFDKNYLNSK